MALRIAVALFVALRAVLVYGEAAQLTTRPVRLPRFRTAAHAPLADVAGPLSGA
jgi:hypothetical protein